jgi:hypothetical protein
VKCVSSLRSIIVGCEDYCCLHSRLSQHDSSLPLTRATVKQRTNKLGRCYQPERPFCTLPRNTLARRTAPFTYMCMSAHVNGRETRVHAGHWHAGHSLRQFGSCLAQPLYRQEDHRNCLISGYRMRFLPSNNVQTGSEAHRRLFSVNTAVQQ